MKSHWDTFKEVLEKVSPSTADVEPSPVKVRSVYFVLIHVDATDPDDFLKTLKALDPIADGCYVQNIAPPFVTVLGNFPDGDDVAAEQRIRSFVPALRKANLRLKAIAWREETLMGLFSTGRLGFYGAILQNMSARVTQLLALTPNTILELS